MLVFVGLCMPGYTLALWKDVYVLAKILVSGRSMQQTNWCISYGFGGWYILQALYEVMNSLSFYAVTVKNVKP